MSSKMKAFVERENSLRLYQERESQFPVVIDPNRPKLVHFDTVYALIEAVKAGDSEKVLELIQNGADINVQNSDGLTCLHYCLLEDEMELFEELLKDGADPNIYDKDMWTPLHLASSQGNKKAVQLLLKIKGIDPIPFDFEGKTPIELVENNKEGTEVKNILSNYLRENKITEQDIQEKKSSPENQMLEELKKAHSEGLPLNQLSEEGGSLLHLAVCRGYVECVTFLLSIAKVDPNIKDSEKWTPIHCASYWGRDSIVSILHKAGADMKATTLTGMTAMDLSQEKTTTETLEQLTRAQTSMHTWSKLRLMMKFALSLSSEKKVSRNTVHRHSLEHKADFTRKLTRYDSSSLKDTRFDEDAPNTPDGKKRRKRRSTGASQGPKLTVSGVSENSFLINIDDFEADWYLITYEVDGDPSSKMVFSEKFVGKEFRIDNLKPNTYYCVEVIPGKEATLIKTLLSAAFITTSEI